MRGGIDKGRAGFAFSATNRSCAASSMLESRSREGRIFNPHQFSQEEFSWQDWQYTK